VTLALAVLAAGPLVVVEPPPAEPAEPVRAHFEYGALVQVEGGSRPDPDEVPGFRVSRARVWLSGQLEQTLHLGGYLQLEASPSSLLVTAPLADAWIGMDVASRSLVDLGRLRIGQMKIPFGGELARPAQALLFVDRAAPLRCLAPGRQQVDPPAGQTAPRLLDSSGRDIGLRWDLDLGLLALGAGVWNGEGPNRVRAPEPAEHAGPLVTARAALALGEDEPSRARLVVGTSFAHGDNAPIGGCTDDRSARRADVTWAGGDLAFRWRWVRLEAEYVFEDDDDGHYGVSGASGLYLIPDFLLLTFRAERVPQYWQWSLGAVVHYYGERLLLQYSFTRRSPSGQASWESAHLVAFTVVL
jgi:hypothetical protein